MTDTITTSAATLTAASTVATFAALRARKPEYEGEIINLTCHTVPGNVFFKGIGGGSFVGSLTAAADDGGTVASNGGTYHWRRQINNLADLNVGDFGAVPDGKTDSLAAVTAMYNFTAKALDDDRTTENVDIAFIAFPAGNFAISSLDIASVYIRNLRINGPVVSFGYSPVARLTLIGAEGSFVFNTNARHTEVSCLEIYGQYDRAANTRGFMTNKCTSGQYYQCDRLRMTQMGGIGFNMLDTLDTKFSSFYTNETYDSILKARPSYSTEGVWDHITAIELSNFNVQNSHTTNAAFDLPKATQCCIYNGWMEKCVFPLDINNGDWTIENFSLEGATVPADITYARVSLRQINLQNAAFNRNNETVVQSLNTYERGYRRDEQYGTTLTGSMAADWYSSNLRFNNTSEKAIWVYVGDYATLTGSDQVVVRFCGAHGEASAASDVINTLSNNFGGGEAILRMRRAPGTNDQIKPVGAVEVRGTSPISDIRLDRHYANSVSIYAQLPKNSGYVHVQVESTSNSRFHSGTCFLWTPQGSVVEDTVVDKLQNSYTPANVAAFSTLNGNGFAIQGDGTLAMTTKALLEGSKLLENTKLRLKINGTNYLLPVEQEHYLSDQFLRAGNINGTLADNKLGGSGTYTWSAGNTGYNAQTGSLQVSAKSNSSAAMRINLKDFTTRFVLVSGPTTADSATPNAGYEFRKATGGVVDCYRLTFQAKDASNNSVMRLVKRVTDSASAVAHTTISPADANVKDGQQIGVTVKGSSIKVYVDGVLLWEITDTTFPEGEVIGFFAGTLNNGYALANLEVFTA